VTAPTYADAGWRAGPVVVVRWCWWSSGGCWACSVCPTADAGEVEIAVARDLPAVFRRQVARPRVHPCSPAAASHTHHPTYVLHSAPST